MGYSSTSLSYSSQCLTYLGLTCQNLARTTYYRYPTSGTHDVTVTAYQCDCNPIGSTYVNLYLQFC